ncbi:hypothetical protein AB0P19_02365 [Microbacterium oleivorans]|uniref:hypothetical protein n=1 Tax=Microbacterium oleivorans TaxID=273677 RepID=UPI00341D28A9
MPDDINFVAILVACLGTGGLGLFAREIADIVSKVRRGVSTRETNRRNDIIGQRDAALARAADQEKRADHEREKRIAWQEHAGRLTFQLRVNGVHPDPLPDGVEDTYNPRKQD